MEYEADYPNAVVIRLEENYRSTKPIQEAASHLIAQNIQRKDKTLWTRREGGGDVRVVYCQDEHAEAAEIARRIAAKLKTGGPRRGYLGIRSQAVELTDEMQKSAGRRQDSALLLVGVEAGSPAAQAGLLVGDLLLGLEGQSVAGQQDLLERLHSTEAGQRLELELLRGGKPLTVAVTLGTRS